MFIQTEITPNPNAVKFYLPRIVNHGDPQHFFNINEAKNSNLALELFNIKAVKEVFIGSDFITITKESDTDWELMQPEILITISDYIASGKPVVEESVATSRVSDKHLPEIEKQIIEIIDTKIRPSVAMDGGDIIYKSFEKGIVTLELRGACSGCPSSTITLKNGIESMLKYYIPEVEAVESIN